MGGGLRRPTGPFQVICVLVAAIAVAFSISPLNAPYDQYDVRSAGGVDRHIARSIETGGSHDKSVDTAKPLGEDMRLPALASGRDA